MDAMASGAIVDVEVIGDGGGDIDATGTALAPARTGPPTLGVTLADMIERTQDVGDYARMETQRLRHIVLTILDESDVYERGKTTFVVDEGWAKVAKRLGISREIVPDSLRVERDSQGVPIAASAICRASWARGTFEDGDGYADINEDTFTDRDGTAKAGGRAKLENALRTRATTRAKKRAVEALLGVGKITRGDVRAAHTQSQVVLPFGPAYDPQQYERIARAISFLAGDPAATERVMARVIDHYGYMPLSAAQALAFMAVEHKRRSDSGPPSPVVPAEGAHAGHSGSAPATAAGRASSMIPTAL